MLNLDGLPILDMSAQIAALPRRKGCLTIPPRTGERWTTFHYSGVIYRDRSPGAERARVINEARHHLGKSWSKPGMPPIYGDRYMYDFVVLSDGAIVRTGPPREFWHCGNTQGNHKSWSVHVMLGKSQELTAAQRGSLFALFVRIGLPVVAHCEWPRTSGEPQPSAVYKLLPGQSECPGRGLHAELVKWRGVA